MNKKSFILPAQRQEMLLFQAFVRFSLKYIEVIKHKEQFMNSSGFNFLSFSVGLEKRPLIIFPCSKIHISYHQKRFKHTFNFKALTAAFPLPPVWCLCNCQKHQLVLNHYFPL